MQKLVKESAEVYYPAKPGLVEVGDDIINFLKHEAAKTVRQCCRLCLHADVSDPVHEMIIVLGESMYVRPHKHLGKSESFHIIEGEVLLVFFTEDGTIEETVTLSSEKGIGGMCCRIAEGRFHTVLPLSEWVVFHEVTKGPFVRNDCEFAPWSPESSSSSEVKKYLFQLKERLYPG